MTEPPIDGPEPELTRAQRRAQRSRRAKRSQRNSPTRAVRRDPGPAPDPDPDPVTAEDAPARDARVPSGPPAAGEPEPEPGPVWPPPVPPAPVAAPPAAPGERVPTRAERRQQRSSGRSRRRAPTVEPDAVAPEPALGSPTEPEVSVPEPVPAPDVVPEPEPEPEPETGPSVPRSQRRSSRGRRGRGTRGATRAGTRAATVAAVPVPVPDPVAAAAPEPVASIAPVAPVAPEDGAPEAPTVAATPAARRRERAARARRTRPAAPPRPGRGLSGRTLWRRVVPLIATGIVAAVVVGVIVRNGDDTVGAGGRGAPARAERSAPMLVVHHGALGNDLVMVTGRDGTTGAVVMAPVATQLDVPSQGVATLRAIPVDDGGALLTTNVENLLGVRIAHTLVLDDAALTAALGPAAPVPVDLSDAVEFADRPARYRPGSQAVSAAQASELIGAPQSVDELDRLVTVAAVMTGWMDRLKDPAIARATLGVQPALEPLIRAAGAPDRRIETVPVDSITTGGGERFNVQLGELEKLVTRVFPHARLGSEGRPRTEILNGTGSLGVAAAVADKVVPAGARVTLTDNLPGFGATSTQVIYYNDQWRVPAQRLLDAMGCGSLRKAGQDIGIVDVTIVVGSDCPAYGFPGGSH